MPTRTAEASELISIAAQYGARHYSVEYLKLPVERDWQHRYNLSDAAGLDLELYYAAKHATRIGREWVLPVEERFEDVLCLKDKANSLGLSFGAADNDLLHLSDGSVCCSGADLLGMGGGFKFTFLSAVRAAFRGNAIKFDNIEREWRPNRPIGEYVNSHSRRPNENIDSFIRARWNGVPNGPSPKSFYGVLDTGTVDDRGMKIYSMEESVRAIAVDRSST